MASTTQPLLGKSNTSSHKKNLYLLLSLVAIFSCFGLVAFNFTQTSSTSLLNNICNKAQNQTSCLSLVSEAVPCYGTMLMSHAKLLQIFLKKSLIHIETTIRIAKNTQLRIKDPKEQSVLADCVELMDMSIDQIKGSIESLDKNTEESNSNAHTWLSGVLTNYVTCQDGLKQTSRISMDVHLDDLILRARSFLAIFVSISRPKNEWINTLSRNFPSWMTDRDRKILQVQGNALSPNVVVAKDGSGNYKTVKEAVASAPDNGKSRYVIYVKKGVYKENVEIGKKKTNVVLTGDGIYKTVITGSLNVVDGSTTFKSATIAVNANGFIAQDIGFQNTAGPQKHQAVALRVSADQVAINRCHIDAYQDTLYAHTNRQFYRDCIITGTVDFIFGNAGVVFQNCKLEARKPMTAQKNMVTAQGREDPNQNTGTSIQKCNITASSDLELVKGSVKTFLGRPWKEYSRTIVMQSYIGDHIDPTGWSEWSGGFALKTLYYGEYMNQGPGAGTSKRVKWPGFRVITSAVEAKKFTVAELIQGGSWLKSTRVTYTEGL